MGRGAGRCEDSVVTGLSYGTKTGVHPLRVSEDSLRAETARVPRQKRASMCHESVGQNQPEFGSVSGIANSVGTLCDHCVTYLGCGILPGVPMIGGQGGRQRPVITPATPG